MTALGFSQFVVGKVLNHTEHGVTAKVYDRNDYLPERGAALIAWATGYRMNYRTVATNITALREHMKNTIRRMANGASTGKLV